MTTRSNGSRRVSFAAREHRRHSEGGCAHPPRERRHAAYPSRDTATIVVGAQDICGRCEDSIVLTLTGWEHE